MNTRDPQQPDPTKKPASALRPISEIWAERERNGRPIKVYSAFPLIGRGTIFHGWIPHAEVEKRFAKALHIPFYMRLKWFIEGWLHRA